MARDNRLLDGLKEINQIQLLDQRMLTLYKLLGKLESTEGLEDYLAGLRFVFENRITELLQMERLKKRELMYDPDSELLYACQSNDLLANLVTKLGLQKFMKLYSLENKDLTPNERMRLRRKLKFDNLKLAMAPLADVLRSPIVRNDPAIEELMDQYTLAYASCITNGQLLLFGLPKKFPSIMSSLATPTAEDSTVTGLEDAFRAMIGDIPSDSHILREGELEELEGLEGQKEEEL